MGKVELVFVCLDESMLMRRWEEGKKYDPEVPRKRVELASGNSLISSK